MSRTPGRTPGRAKRGEETYLPYNADPKKVGTRSNAQMPTNVQLTEDGFEDPEAFFYSPTNTDATNRSLATTAFQTPGGVSTYSAQTPMTAGSVGVLRRTGSRLSGMDYDDEDDEIADDLLVDEDDLRMATPSQNASQRYFPQINPPSVILPTRSRPLVDSPSVNMSFDALPSPSRSLRTPHAVNRSPRKSVASLNQISPSSSTLAKPSSMNGQDRSPLRASRGGVDLGEEEDITSTSIADYSAMSMDISIAASPSRGPTRTSPRRGKTTSPNQSMRNAARKSRSGQNLSMAQGDGNDSRLEDDSRIDDEDRPDVTPDAGRKISRMSTMSKKSNATRNGDDVGDEDLSRDREGSFSDNDNAPDFGYDAGPDNGSELDGFNDTVNDVSIGFDDDDVRQSGNVGALVDDMAAGGGEERADEEGTEDISMEQEAVADEERSGEEEVTPQPKKRGPPKKAAQATRERAPPRPRGVREGSVAAKPRKTRISQIGLEDGYHGNFATRRSKRKHFKPLEWWRNEHFEYARGPGLPVIKEVVTYPEEPPTPFAQRHKRGRTRTGRSISAAPNGKRRKNSLDDDEQEAEDDEQTWDAQTVPSGLVQDYPTKNEVYRRIACIKAQLEPRAVSKGAYQYQKVFGEGQFMAAGVVYIPIGSSKATKPSKDNAYVFYVIQGVVQVTVHRTSFVMAPGGQFLIPRGNEYRIENISPNREVQLFFAQARKLRADESELEPSYATTAAAAGDRLSVSLDENTSKTGATSKRTSKNKDKDV
ncbi:hypothetical protein I316_02203 [Kwoniella heveanensis BCC8398]|uniref:CENP-C homolog n=1 Tax=Kwoniella heveanensis BCC8398 TaxID=1296120 RepID=A0A1B9GZ68_9TREE|nr:hypothetical protein I316_02203 [Kwoniella heveanensis BCC8398]